MEILISGKNLDLGEALQLHVREHLTDGIRKYFDRGADAQVTFAAEAPGVECEVTTHLVSGVYLAASGRGADAYSAFGEALGKIEKRVRRHKRRLKDHHNDVKDPLPAENAAYFTLAAPSDEPEDTTETEENTPVIVAESQTPLLAMSVSDAVMQLDLGEKPAFVFRNAKHGRVNVVYRRSDGHIGWIDPA